MPDVFECGLIGMGPAGIGLAMSFHVYGKLHKAVFVLNFVLNLC